MNVRVALVLGGLLFGCEHHQRDHRRAAKLIDECLHIGERNGGESICLSLCRAKPVGIDIYPKDGLVDQSAFGQNEPFGGVELGLRNAVTESLWNDLVEFDRLCG